MGKVIVAKRLGIVTTVITVLFGILSGFCLHSAMTTPRIGEFQQQFDNAIEVRIAPPFRTTVEMPIPVVALGEGPRSNPAVKPFPLCIDFRQDQSRLNEKSGAVAELTVFVDSQPLTVSNQYPSVYETSKSDRLKHHAWVSQPGVLRIQLNGISGLKESSAVTMSLRRCIEGSHKDGTIGSLLSESISTMGKLAGVGFGVFASISVWLLLWRRRLQNRRVTNGEPVREIPVGD